MLDWLGKILGRGKGRKAGSAEPAPRDLFAELMSACERSDAPAAMEALEAGADPNALSREGCSPLMAASGAGNADMARLLLERGALPGLRGAGGRNAAFFAAREGSVECLELLGKAGLGIDEPCCDQGWTALMCAVREGHEAAGMFLLGMGADPCLVAHGGKTALTLADPGLCGRLRAAVACAVEKKEMLGAMAKPAQTEQDRPGRKAL